MSSEHDVDSGLLRDLEELVARYRQHGEIDWDEVARAEPDRVDELRELFAVAAIAEEVAASGSVSGTLELDAAVATDGLVPSGLEDYVIDGELGRGGMGVVYRAWQSSLNRTVAIKRVLSGALASQADLARFRTEAESAAQLNHPHIVSIYEVGTAEDGVPYFSMQYVEGTTLGDRIAEGPLSAREAATLLLPICRAIAHAHRQGVLHRDLKPSNILIDQDGTPYVSDFGLAKWTERTEQDGTSELGSPRPSSLTRSGAVMGTPSYLAPEQASGRRDLLAATTDVYGLGAILYAMLTGRPPFQAETPLQTLQMVVEQDPVPPRVLNPLVDHDLEMVALKCLQKPIDLRYQSADELADDLERYLRDEPVSARSSQFTQIVTRAFRETHHAGVLKNWGLLWMWHAVVLLVLCTATNILILQGVTTRLPYLGLWVVGAGLWAAVFWELRRRAGPVTFVERVLAHLWAGSMIADTLLFALEWLLDLRVLTLSPVLALIGGMIFLVKASLLNGMFYIPAIALFLTAVPMAAVSQSRSLPDFSISLLGIVLAASFFFPGWKYHERGDKGRMAGG